mgnify:CR=1 FL=1
MISSTEKEARAEEIEIEKQIAKKEKELEELIKAAQFANNGSYVYPLPTKLAKPFVGVSLPVLSLLEGDLLSGNELVVKLDLTFGVGDLALPSGESIPSLPTPLTQDPPSSSSP